MSENLPKLRVTEIGEFIRYRSCERRFKLGFNNRAEAKNIPFYGRLFNAIDPVLQESGRQREEQWEDSLVKAGLSKIAQIQQSQQGETRYATLQEFGESLQGISVGQNVFGREIEIEATLGAFQLSGRIDFILVRWNNDTPFLSIVETKASRRDRTYHRVQLTLYLMMIKEMLSTRPIVIAGKVLSVDNIAGMVARIDEATSRAQDILSLEPFTDLEREESDILRLIATNGPLVRISNTSLDKLDYQLGSKCDGCVFNTHCLPESARQRRLELLGLDPSIIRVLTQSGIIDIDALANIDVSSTTAFQIRNNPAFTVRLDIIKQQAISRRTTLPNGLANPDEYPVTGLPCSPQSQLPEYTINGQRLVRIYLNVDYDYIENRVAGLSAHITKSDGNLNTANRTDQYGKWIGYDPVVQEITQGNARPLQGEEVIEYLEDGWTGRYEVDTGVERQLIQGFFRKLVRTIDRVSGEVRVPIHFYIWSRSEMTHLIEACSRVDSRLLSSLRELLGCREGLDQLIYSCIQQEIENRFALGWTGRGLVVAASLTWFGKRYHWLRKVSGVQERLDILFTQDIFDFKTDLFVNPDGSWSEDSEIGTGISNKFEVRSRFFDSLTSPYWYAYWQSDLLPSPNSQKLSPQVKDAIQRYRNAVKMPSALEEYLRARVHALRWLEEKVIYKNAEIQKLPVTIAELPKFDLGVNNTALAAIDFLRLDHQVKVTDWIAEHLTPPANRVPKGEAIPVRNVMIVGTKLMLEAEIAVEPYNVEIGSVNERTKLREDSIVRLTPCSADPNKGQTLSQLTSAGRTCRINRIDWNSGRIYLSVIPSVVGSRYVLKSPIVGDLPQLLFDYATIDEGVSDFVSDHVEERLMTTPDSPAYSWFSPLDPKIPNRDSLSSSNNDQLRKFLEDLLFPNNRRLVKSQIDAIIEGIDTKIQLLQGPPGTGKTATTAVSTLLRIMLFSKPGDIVLIGTNTHAALDNLLERIAGIVDVFRQTAMNNSSDLSDLVISKVHSSAQSQTQSKSGIKDFPARNSKTFVKENRKGKVLLIGGVTSAILKFASNIKGKDLPNGLSTSLLIIDEASMIVFPHFLALATLVDPTGQIMLTGDNRQLSPIVAHDWESEDRPPVILYQPYVSAYQAVENLAQNYQFSVNAMRRSRLSYTFRLPSAIRELIARLYRRDDIELEGLAQSVETSSGVSGSWEKVWEGETGLYLVLHNERGSRQSNELEIQIIESLLDANPQLPERSVAIVTPYTTQRALVRARLNVGNGPIDLVDTVERLQGGERPTVIVSAVASDPYAISANAEFILNLNRSNVAFSRSQERLIVICSEELINHIPADLEQYDSTMLWKALRNVCSELVAEIDVNGYTTRIFQPSISESIISTIPE